MTAAELKPPQIKALLLLLVLVPFIPTVLMLRFLLDAVETERTTDRITLESFYRQSLSAVGPSALNRIIGLSFDAANSPEQIFKQLLASGSVDGAIVYAIDGTQLYPPHREPPRSTAATGEPLQQALRFSEDNAAATANILKTPFDPSEQWRAVQPPDAGIFALALSRAEKRVVVLRKRDTLRHILHDFYRKAFDPAVKVVVLDGSQIFPPTSGEQNLEPVARGVVPGMDPGWQVLLYPTETRPLKSILEDRAAYLWAAGIAIIADILIAAAAVLAVNQQLRLHDINSTTLATVSHELKTPLASTRVLLDTMLEGRCRDKQQEEEYLQLIARENERMTRLVENFLTLARFEKGAYLLNKTTIPPGDLLRSAMEGVDLQVHGLDCQLSLEIAERLPEASVDREAMISVFVNLLENALKYTGAVKKIRLGVSLDHNRLRWDITDNGIGLGKREQRHIFRPFYQVDQKLARRTEGCGLGLSIARFIVEAHQGVLAVRSEPGRGSTFSVWLPAASETST